MLANHVTCVSHVRMIRGGKKDYRSNKTPWKNAAKKNCINH